MSDGSRPEAAPLEEALAQRFPLAAFALLERGDVFEAGPGARPAADGGALASSYVRSCLRLHPHGASAQDVAHVEAAFLRVLSGNRMLSERMRLAKPLHVELIPPGQSLVRYGYPAAVSPRAAGLFWNQDTWPAARMALRRDALYRERALVVHELAHALQALAFTGAEQELIYRAMLRTYRSKVAVDEVFAIYSEREFIDGEFTARDQRAPGVYGVARQRWSEDHVFTRFVRHLYHPSRPLAGPRSG